MKITGITSIGTFYVPWIKYTIKSIYDVCDEIIVVNVGYDLENPKENQFIKLQQVSDDIKQIDDNGKIIEVNELNVIHQKPLMWQKEADSKHVHEWYDIVGLGFTKANEEAYRRGADYILKFDSDQVCYDDVKNIKNLNDNVYFYQYEFAGSIGNDAYFLTNRPDNKPHDNAVYFYKSNDRQWYAGSGAPCLYLDKERKEIDYIHCAHMKYAYLNTWTESLSKLYRYQAIYMEKRKLQNTNFNTKIWEDSIKELSTRPIPFPVVKTDVKPPEVCKLQL